MRKSLTFLVKKAKILRKEIITMAYYGRGPHITSSLSIADILTVLYWDILKINPRNTSVKTRDRFILSKGHAVSALYAVLAHRGFFSRELLKTYGKNGTILAGHPEHLLAGIELSTGSLGHGLPVGTGMALSSKLDNKPYRVFVLVSDAECQEGTIWESVLLSAHHKLNNLCAIIDYNKLQAFGKTNKIVNLEPFAKKWKAFGWDIQEINGHDLKALQKAFNAFSKNKHPTAVICHTIGGKGVSFMENQVKWHYHNLDETLYKRALEEIDKNQ